MKPFSMNRIDSGADTLSLHGVGEYIDSFLQDTLCAFLNSQQPQIVRELRPWIEENVDISPRSNQNSHPHCVRAIPRQVQSAAVEAQSFIFFCLSWLHSRWCSSRGQQDQILVLKLFDTMLSPILIESANRMGHCAVFWKQLPPQCKPCLSRIGTSVQSTIAFQLCQLSITQH
jgi:hypothetical protein